MVKLAPRRRPRRRSLDWSRLGWLITTEAAFQVYLSQASAAPDETLDRFFFGRGLPTLAEMRLGARHILKNQEVIV